MSKDPVLLVPRKLGRASGRGRHPTARELAAKPAAGPTEPVPAPLAPSRRDTAQRLTRPAAGSCTAAPEGWGSVTQDEDGADEHRCPGWAARRRSPVRVQPPGGSLAVAVPAPTVRRDHRGPRPGGPAGR